MWLFIMQYRKLLALCAVPVIAAAAFFGYRLVHAQSNHNEAYAVNAEMQSLLKEVNGPTSPNVHEISDTPVPDTATQSDMMSTEPSSKPEATLKAHSPKPKTTAKPKATPKPASTAKATASS